MKSILFILCFFTLSARGELIRPGYEGVRPTGMGDAFTALADDHNALFYNPAGLANIKGVHFNLFDFTVGADSSNTINRLNNAIFKSDFEHLLTNDQQYLKLAFKPTFIVPGFGFSFFQDAHGFFDMGDPINNGIDVYGQNDLGVIAGFGLPLGEQFSLGFSSKVFQRSGVDMSYTPEELINDIGFVSAIMNGTSYNIFEDAAKSGWAASLNFGAIARVPLQEKGKNAPRLTASAVLDNIGGTTFKSLGSERMPDTIKQSVTFGLAYQSMLDKNWTWNVVADMKNALVAQSFLRQFHVGTEFRHKILGLRAGFSQGYPTAGFSIEFPPHTRIHFSTHAKELGDNFQERSHRWYLLQFIVGFNPI